MSIVSLVDRLIWFYSMLLFVYVLLSWFPSHGAIEDLRRVLATLCEPYLGIFRRFIPPLGMMDISPIVGFLVLNYVIRPVLIALAAAIGA